MLKLFYHPGACSIASHIALEEAGAKYELQPVDISVGEQLASEYRAINPKMRVPALLTERGVITENPAILAYVAQTHPDAQLAPLDHPFDFAEFQAFNMFLAATIHPSFRQFGRPSLYVEGSDATVTLRKKVMASINHFFELIETRFADGRPWVHGNAHSLSDSYLFFFSTYLEWGQIGDASLFPAIRTHRQRMRQRPAVTRVIAREGLGPAW